MSRFGDRVEYVEDVATPIRGWRAWRIGHDGERLRLCSVVLGRRGFGTFTSDTGSSYHVWDPAGIEARCFCMRESEIRMARMGFLDYRDVAVYSGTVPLHRTPPGKGPELKFTGGWGCGVYAMKQLEDLRGTSWYGCADVVGQVELGGRLWEHELGWRAQYARPVRLLRKSEGFSEDTRSSLPFQGFDPEIVLQMLRGIYRTEDQ